MRLAGHLGLPQLSVATTQLLVDSAGRKLGKSTGGAVWLDPTRTPIFDFYQYFLGMDDTLARSLLPALLPPTVSQEEIDATLGEEPESRAVQRAVADSVTGWVHGEEAVEGATAAGPILFRDRGAAIAASLQATGSLAPGQAAALSVVRRVALDETPTTVTDAFVRAGLCSSRSELRRLVKGRGVRLNGALVEREAAEGALSPADVLTVPGVGRCFLGSVGKSTMAVVTLP
jgi:tyrosyl-tRNA synthetase